MTPDEGDALLPGESELPEGHRSGFVAVIGLPATWLRKLDVIRSRALFCWRLLFG